MRLLRRRVVHPAATVAGLATDTPALVLLGIAVWAGGALGPRRADDQTAGVLPALPARRRRPAARSHDRPHARGRPPARIRGARDRRSLARAGGLGTESPGAGVLITLGKVESALARSAGSALGAGLRPVSGVPVGPWLATVDDGSPEVAIATVIASLAVGRPGSLGFATICTARVAMHVADECSTRTSARRCRGRELLLHA